MATPCTAEIPDNEWLLAVFKPKKAVAIGA
jgi:hypothetical protein